VIASTVTATVVTTVTTMVVTSVVASVAGGTSIPSPDPIGLIAMVSVVQGASLKSQLQIGKIPTAFSSLASNMGFLNFKTNIFTSIIDSKSRKLLSIPHDSEQWNYAIYLIISYACIVTPFILAHFALSKILAKKGKSLNGILGFPQLEFILAFTLITPFSKASASMLVLGTFEAYCFGIILLVLVPVPILSFGIFYIHKYAIRERKIKYSKRLHRFNDWMVSRPFGTWRGNRKVLDKVGIFVKNSRGPIHNTNPMMVMYDKLKNKYIQELQSKSMSTFTYFQLFSIPLKHLRMVLNAIILGSFSSSSNGSIPQLVLLNLLFGSSCVYNLFISPENLPKAFITEIVSSTGELCVYASAMTLLIARRLNSSYALSFEGSMGSIMVSCQLVSIFIHIISQVWGIIVIVYNVGVLILAKIKPYEQDESVRMQWLQRKYGRKWFLNTSTRRIQIAFTN
jgi:hypothetical protein